MDGSPGRMIAGSVACNAVLRWEIDADNALIAGLIHFDRSPLQITTGAPLGAPPCPLQDLAWYLKYHYSIIWYLKY
jgi:hypothetical protein